MLIVDTGVLVAAADSNDPRFQACAQLLEEDDGPLITTALVVAEAAYLLERELGTTAELALYTTIIDGDLTIEPLAFADWQRVHELVERYRDLPLGGTDASLVALAERLRVDRVATLDRRHFGTVRPVHVPAFQLLP